MRLSIAGFLWGREQKLTEVNGEPRAQCGDLLTVSSSAHSFSGRELKSDAH